MTSILHVLVQVDAVHVALACAALKLTPAEAINAANINAAAYALSLGSTCGSLGLASRLTSSFWTSLTTATWDIATAPISLRRWSKAAGSVILHGLSRPSS